jgi:ABC-2 type transport system permease protein/lipopolysaccharide transport system permease protein
MTPSSAPPTSVGPAGPDGTDPASSDPTRPPPADDAGPPRELLFRRHLGIGTMVRELVGAKELVAALTERDFRARYKQTKVGVAWAVLTPVLLLGAFTILANTAAHFETDGVPYPLFASVALVPWTFFSNAVATGSVSITSNLSLINKVYCPREVFPLAAIGTATVDAGISFVLLVLLFIGYGRGPTAEAVWVPVLLTVQIAFTVGATLVLSSLVVYLRDLRQILPLALQFALFATPVAYSFDQIDPAWQPVASAVNPLAPIIEGYRHTVLLGTPPDWGLVGIAAAAAATWLAGGYLVFKRLETGFADVA